jgi:hypothetical protein
MGRGEEMLRGDIWCSEGSDQASRIYEEIFSALVCSIVKYHVPHREHYKSLPLFSQIRTKNIVDQGLLLEEIFLAMSPRAR